MQKAPSPQVCRDTHRLNITTQWFRTWNQHCKLPYRSGGTSSNEFESWEPNRGEEGGSEAADSAKGADPGKSDVAWVGDVAGDEEEVAPLLGEL